MIEVILKEKKEKKSKCAKDFVGFLWAELTVLY